MEIPEEVYNANLNTTFSIYELPTPSATPSTRPLPRREIDVRFSFTLDGDDDFEPQTLRLNCEKPDVELDCYIYEEIGCFRWPMEEVALYDIPTEVVRKARLLACDLRVEIDTVYVGPMYLEEDYNDDRESVVEISSLTRKRIDEEDKEDEDCCGVICLEELTAGTEVPTLSCGHFRFHDHCISTWFAKRPSCPLCRCKMMRSES